MKKILILALICGCVFCIACGNKKEKEKKDSLVKKGTKSVVSGLVSSGKDAISGLKEGVDDGRKSGDSLDGAIVVNNQEDMIKYLTVSATMLEKEGEGRYIVHLAIKNNTPEVVRLANLHEVKSIILLDKEGFATMLPKSPDQRNDITVVGDTAVRKRYLFTNVEGEPAIIRLYGHDIVLPEAVDSQKDNPEQNQTAKK